MKKTKKKKASTMGTKDSMAPANTMAPSNSMDGSTH
jgi:hypothetical protein